MLALCAAVAACGQAAAPDQENVSDRVISAAAPAAEAAEAAPPAPPPELQQALSDLAGGFQGEVGIAVKDLQQDWVAEWRGSTPMPQQSVMKIWLAVAVLDAVDREQLSLDETIAIGPHDLSLFYQPVKPKVLDDGVHVATIDELLAYTISRSDNATTDVLMRRMGGEAAVQETVERKGLAGVEVGPEERLLQPVIAGLEWRPEFADLATFNKARDAVPEPERNAALAAYLRDPPDAASAVAVVDGLDALKEGRLLSRGSTQRLLDLMVQSKSGPKRLRAGLGEGWTIAHKTGTGPTRDGYAVGQNDVGVLTAPDGRSYAVAVMIARTEEGLNRRLQLMADVSRAVVAHWERTQPGSAATGAASSPPA